MRFVARGCFQKLGRRSCRTRCKGSRGDPNGFTGVGVRWGQLEEKSIRDELTQWLKYLSFYGREEINQLSQLHTNNGLHPFSAHITKVMHS